MVYTCSGFLPQKVHADASAGGRQRFPCRRKYVAALALIGLLMGTVFAEDMLLPNLRVYDTGSGLSQGSVLDIVQDSLGYVWLATQDGLNKFDGYDFTVIRPGMEQNNTQQFYKALLVDGHTLYAGSWGGGLWAVNLQTLHSDFLGLRNMDIRSLALDADGALWIACYGDGVFSLLPDNTFKQHSLAATDRVNKLLFHPGGGLFAGTDEGLFKYDESSSRFVSCDRLTERRTQAERAISALAVHDKQQLWLATQKGLLLYDFVNLTVQEYTSQTHPVLGDDNILSLYDDGVHVWLGTSIGGLYKLSLQSRSFLHYIDNQNRPLSGINSIAPDFEGNVLLGANGSFSIHTPVKPFWQAYVNDPEDDYSLPANQFWQLYLDRSVNLWMGTFSSGLIKFDLASGAFLKLRNNPADPASLANNAVFSVVEDARGRIWSGTNSGLSSYDPLTGRFRNYYNQPDNERSLSGSAVWCLFVDSKQRMWVGTRTRGLNLHNPESDDFSRYAAEPGNPAALQSNFIYTMFEDSVGIIWIGTIGGGLHRMNPDNTFTNYRADPAVSSSLPNDFVLFIDEYKPGKLWITTNGGGIALFDTASETFKVFQERDGLPNNVVYAMLRDNAGLYWLSTNNGISVFDPATATFRNFNTNDGLPWLEFNGKSHARTADGQLYFGSTKGLLKINPAALVKNTYEPIVRLQQLRINNEQVPVMAELSGGRLVSYLDRLVLRPEHRQFSVDFSSSSYTAPRKNQYRYRLLGFDTNWINSDDRRASYTNLPAGSFRLEVQGSNNDGLWSSRSAFLEIKIIPAWHENRVYRVIFVAIVLSLAVLVIYGRVHALKRNNQTLIMLISNLAHELNSPLGVLSSSVAVIDAELAALLAPMGLSPSPAAAPDLAGLRRLFLLDDTEQRLVDCVKREQEIHALLEVRNDLDRDQKRELAAVLAMHGFRLGQYTEQLLALPAGELYRIAAAAGILSALSVNGEALRKADNVITTLKIYTKAVSDTAFEQFDLKAQLVSVARRFEGKLGQLAELRLELQDGLYLSGLVHQLELVWDALLSNAIDAALERTGSRIELRAVREAQMVVISVSDNGPHIPFWRRHKIYRPFYSTKQEGAGRGLGLTVARLIVQAHGGTIRFTSLKSLTTFIVCLPVIARSTHHE